jgi:hypothetical protein
VKFLRRRGQLLTTKQQSRYQTRFELDRKETEKVCENATECALSVHVRCESVICPGDQNIQKGESVVILKFFCKLNAFVPGVHVLHEFSVVITIAT